MSTKLDGLHNPVDPNGEYYVQDTRGVVGNCLSFWGKNRAGYVCELDRAGVYKGSEVARMDRETDVPWPRAVVEQYAIRHVRIEPLVRYRDGDKSEEDEAKIANARLIAAAPDLYEALKSALRYVSGEVTTPPSYDAIMKMRLALARAKGGLDY